MNERKCSFTDKVNDWLWTHHGDEFDAFLTWRRERIEWCKQRLCIAFGHRWDYMGPGPYDWDGEGTTFCARCCEYGDRSNFFRLHDWTWGDEFWPWLRFVLNPRAMYLSDCAWAKDE